MHPTSLFIETLVNEKLPPGHGAVSVQPLLADHMNFAPKIKRGMRVDQKKRIARRGLFWGNGDPVGTPRFCKWRYIKISTRSDLRRRLAKIKIANTLQINPFNVATNGSLTKVHRHPRLEVIDAPRLDVWMGVQKIIQTVSKRVTQRS